MSSDHRWSSRFGTSTHSRKDAAGRGERRADSEVDQLLNPSLWQFYDEVSSPMVAGCEELSLHPLDTESP